MACRGFHEPRSATAKSRAIAKGRWAVRAELGSTDVMPPMFGCHKTTAVSFVWHRSYRDINDKGSGAI